MTTNNTTLSFKRIFLSLLGFIIIPFNAALVDSIIHNQVVAYTLSFHLSGMLLVALNWDIMAIHYHRFIEDKKESFFFVTFGCIALGIAFILNHFFLHAYTLTLNPEEVKDISFFIPFLLFAYTLLFSSLYLISFKCLSDRLVIKKAEATVIFFSSFLFTLLFVISFVPFDTLEWLKGYIFYFFITMILSYLYHQTKSLMTSLVSFTLVLLIVNIIILLS